MSKEADEIFAQNEKVYERRTIFVTVIFVGVVVMVCLAMVSSCAIEIWGPK